MKLSDSQLNTIAKRYINENTEAIILVGSYARNNQKPDSDIDITMFQKDLKTSQEIKREQYDGYQLSIYKTTIHDYRDSFSDPTRAIWTIDYLRTARPLYDPHDTFAKVQNEAQNFDWKNIQAAANIAASHKLEKYTEEVIKIVSGLKEKDDFTILNALGWLYIGLPIVIALQKGIFLINESSFFKQIVTALGEESDWSKYFLFASGIKTHPSKYSPMQTRGIAGLHLYKETVKIIKEFLVPEDLININKAQTLIDTQLKEIDIKTI